MATEHWRTGLTVADLFNKPDAGWQFHQLVRVMLPPDTADDELLQAIDQNIEFVGSLARDFPPGDIRHVKPKPADGGKARITCSSYNLAGLGGPLPEPFVEMLQQDVLKGNGTSAMADFINIFNSRIQALRYLTRAYSDDTMTCSAAEHSVTGKTMLALSGHLSEFSRQLHDQSIEVLVGLAGILANRRMSLPTIRTLPKVVLNLNVIEMTGFIGRWLYVDEEDHSLLGRANHRLGSEATLGRKVWDQQAAFGLTLGPLPFDKVERLLPGGVEHKALRQLVEWISDMRCDCLITLQCEQNFCPIATLNSKKDQTNALGFGTWLGGKQSDQQQVSFMLNIAH